MDLFSKQAIDYSKYRPHYPADLYRFLTVQCRHHLYAWDVATGNGQAAVELANTFQKVLATDLSASQIEQTVPHKSIVYRTMPAEQALSEADETFDLITVATGLHWLDRDVFFKEATRVLKPGGVFAAWAYGFHSSITPEIDRTLHSFYFDTLKGFWRENNQHVWNGYKNIVMPFQRIATPKVEMKVDWSIDDFIGYCGTWSAVQLYKEQHHRDPTVELREKLVAHWGAQRRSLGWKLGFIAGRK